MNVSDNSNETLLRDFDDQEFWRASVGLDLTDRTVLEAGIDVADCPTEDRKADPKVLERWRKNL